MRQESATTICLNSKVDGKQPSLADRVYHTGGVSVAVTSSFMPSIAEPFIVAQRGREVEPNVLTQKRTEYGKQIRKQYENKQLKTQRKHMQQFEPRTDGVSNSLTTVQKDNLLAEPLKVKQATAKGYVEVPPGGVFDGSYPESETRRGRVQDGGTVSPALTAEGQPPLEYETYYRIRKLTPRECFRLMGVRDKDIDKIQAYPFASLEEYREAIKGMSEKEIKRFRREHGMISDARQYKMAGNSIVENCLYLIFKNVFITKAKPKAKVKQLTIFDML
ncbi:MAG: hypothetical protein UH853_06340 [Muribaculaceae bacterium]|nr:hypothetical protein [Muribaculaceae bacterium]